MKYSSETWSWIWPDPGISFSQLTALWLTSCSRVFCQLLATISALRTTGGVSWQRTRWSVLVEVVSQQVVMWVKERITSSVIYSRSFGTRLQEKLIICNVKMYTLNSIVWLCKCMYWPTGGLWWTSKLPEHRWILGRPWRCELWLWSRL